MVGFLWADDLTSSWVQEYARDHDVRTKLIYQHRGIAEIDREEILKKVESGELPVPAPNMDPYSTEVSPGANDASLVLRILTLVNNASFDAIAPYHPTAAGGYSRIDRRPPHESATSFFDLRSPRRHALDGQELGLSCGSKGTECSRRR